jgi:methylmalonyl-CoA mutase cobalamin-binding subunit
MILVQELTIVQQKTNRKSSAAVVSHHRQLGICSSSEHEDHFKIVRERERERETEIYRIVIGGHASLRITKQKAKTLNQMRNGANLYPGIHGEKERDRQSDGERERATGLSSVVIPP